MNTTSSPIQQQPKRSHIRRAAAGLAVVALLGVGVVGCLAQDNTDTVAPKASTSTATVAPDKSSPKPATCDAIAPIGGTVKGHGYKVQLPAEWRDGTKAFEDENPDLITLDRVLIWGDTFGTARANVIVETQSSFGKTDPDSLRATWIQSLTSDDKSAKFDVLTNDNPTILCAKDLDPMAVGVSITRTNERGVDVRQESVLVIHGNKAYSITNSYKDGDTDSGEAFNDILSGWQWADTEAGA